MEKYINKIINADCMDILKELSDKCIDMILCDLPYGTTSCKWDKIIPIKQLLWQYYRIIKDNSAIVLLGREPYTSKLIISNLKEYKHKWIWNKKQSGSLQMLNLCPYKSMKIY